MPYTPTFSEFAAAARRGNLIPVTAELPADLDTPVSAYLKVARGPYSYLLESVEGSEQIARYSFIGAEPAEIWECRGADASHRIMRDGARSLTRSVLRRDPLSEIEQLLSRFHYVPRPGLPRFSGGLVGYLGYDVARAFERLPDRRHPGLEVPDARLMLSDTLLIFDHVKHCMTIVAHAYLGDRPSRRGAGSSAAAYSTAALKRAYGQATGRIDRVMARLRRPLPRPNTLRASRSAARPALRSNMSKARFIDAVDRAKAYIRAGDIIQVVLSQRWETPMTNDPFAVYRVLRSVNPSPYMYYLKLGDATLVGTSPELFLRCENGVAEVRPIAGTRPRGDTPSLDAQMERDLQADPKERAEHVMLVDLGRNDLGRVCEYASVEVPEFMITERYSHVMHLVSRCTGRLRKPHTAFDAVRAAFPAGTLSGAPKIRAMEIIEELEPSRRGPYGGIIGYFSFSGNVDSCITIRTMLVTGGKGYIQAGAGIVADSVPEREYEETRNKAAALVQAVQRARQGGE